MNYAPINGIYEDFEDGTALNWAYTSGDWFVSNYWGFYAFHGDNYTKEATGTFYNCRFSNFDLEVEMMKNDESLGSYGLFFCADPSVQDDLGLYLNTYYLVITTNGYWNLHARVNGELILIQSDILSPDLLTGLGVMNTARIAFADGNMDIYFNGVFQGSYYDDNFFGGKLGAFIYDTTLNHSGEVNYVNISPITSDYTFDELSQPHVRLRCNNARGEAMCQRLNELAFNKVPAPLPPVRPYNYSPDNVFNHFAIYRSGSNISNTTNTQISTTLPDYGLFSYHVCVGYDEGESQPSNQEAEWYIEEPVITKQTPYPPLNESAAGYTSDTTIDFVVYDRFVDNDGIITGIEFVGLNLSYDSGWVACEEDPMKFRIDICENDEIIPGNVVASFYPTISRINTGIYLDLGFPAEYYLYRYTFPQPVAIDTGWIAIAGAGADEPDCWFMMLNSDIGDHRMLFWDGYAFNPKGTNAAISLLGGWQPSAPLNLNAAVDLESGQVDLSWMYTPNPLWNFDHYNVYRDGNIIGTSETPNYTDQLPLEGYYEYNVSALYEEGETDTSATTPVEWYTDITEIETIHIRVFPNPAKDVLNIESAVIIRKVELFHLIGNVVFEKEINQESISINTHALSNGIYLLKLVMDGDIIVVGKVLIKRE